MQFHYEIPVDEYVAAQMLYYREYGKSKFVKRALGSVLLGSFFFLIAAFRGPEWAPILLLVTGAWYIYGGIASLYPTRYWGIASPYPTRYYRRTYPESGLAGKNYHAELDENGFSVTGDSRSWRVPWSKVRLKSEDKCVFIFFAEDTIFIFGKKYLTDEQQRDIRQFVAMP